MVIRLNYLSKFVLFAVLSFVFLQCEDDCNLPEPCNLAPQSGPCLALIIKYYYDQQERRCKDFIWGGCGGVVPFQTLQECEEKCNCN